VTRDGSVENNVIGRTKGFASPAAAVAAGRIVNRSVHVVRRTQTHAPVPVPVDTCGTPSILVALCKAPEWAADGRRPDSESSARNLARCVRASCAGPRVRKPCCASLTISRQRVSTECAEARSGRSPSCGTLIDGVPLSRLPALPRTHRMAARRLLRRSWRRIWRRIWLSPTADCPRSCTRSHARNGAPQRTVPSFSSAARWGIIIASLDRDSRRLRQACERCVRKWTAARLGDALLFYRPRTLLSLRLAFYLRHRRLHRLHRFGRRVFG